MEEILYQYGPLIAYFILLLGSFVEGESFVLTAGFLAYKGFLSLPVIIMISFFGSLFSDQFLFHIGRHYGPSIIERRPRLKERSKRVFELLHKYSTGFIIGFRFVYGVRTISPLVIGASGISVKRFTVLNFFAALLWAVISCLAGYLIGYLFADAVDLVIKKVIQYQKIAVGGTVGILCLAGLYFYVKKIKRKKD